MTPQEKAKQLFNSIRYMDNESAKDCATCDCVVLPIAKFMCDEIIEELKGFNSDDGYFVLRIDFWDDVKSELSKL